MQNVCIVRCLFQVAKWVKQCFFELSDGKLQVKAQDRGYYLFDKPKRFRLRPDIVVRGTDDDEHGIVIMDTKWKRLNADPATNYGISQQDMYQMYAYAKKYHTSKICLIYPYHEGVVGLDDITFYAVEGDEPVNVQVRFIDLLNSRKGIEELFSSFWF